MLLAALFVTALNWVQAKWLPTGKWINEVWYSHTTEYYSARRGKELFTHTTVRINLKTNYAE